MQINREKAKKMTNLQRSDLYNELADFIMGVEEDLEGGIARKGSPEYRSLKQSMHEAERNMAYLQRLMDEDNLGSENAS